MSLYFFKFLPHHILTLTVVCVCLVFLPQYSFASIYTVSPLVIDHELEKREIIEEKITLTNKENYIVQIFPTVNEVSVNEGGGVQGFVPPSMTVNKGTSITSWLKIGRGQIELQPGETREVTLTIQVNPEVEAGEYHAFVGFPEGSNRPEAEKLVFENRAPGTVVRIGVDKVQNQFLRLEKFSVKRFVRESSKDEISFTLINPGDDPVTPRGEIIFYDNNGIEVTSLLINTATTTIEGKKSADFVYEAPEAIKMGKYKAFLTVEYGEHQTASLNDTAFFFVLPLKLLAMIFVGVLLFAVALALFIHRRYDVDEDDDGVNSVAMYIRQSRSESKDHDIDLSKKNSN